MNVSITLTLYLYVKWLTVNISMDLNAFSHGQVQSKIWLCEILEPYLKSDDKIAILGCWYSVLSFMLGVRKPNFYESIVGYDIDDDAVKIADKITESWRFLTSKKFKNITADVNNLNLEDYNVVISTSVEHITMNDWFNNLKTNTLVCLQSSTLGTDVDYFKVSNQNKSLEELKQKYPLSKIVYEGELDFDYPVNPYKRLMIIGYK